MSEGPTIQHKPIHKIEAGFGFENGVRVPVVVPVVEDDSAAPQTAAEKHMTELRQLAEEVRRQTLRGVVPLLKSGRKKGLSTRLAALEILCDNTKTVEGIASEYQIDRSTLSRAVTSMKDEVYCTDKSRKKPSKIKGVS